MASYYNSSYEFSKNIPNYQSCYYQRLGNYSDNGFCQVRFNPPLSDAIVYRDVYYAPPNYQSLIKPVDSTNVNYNYSSITNAYCPCQDCRYATCGKCENYSNKCMN